MIASWKTEKWQSPVAVQVDTETEMWTSMSHSAPAVKSQTMLLSQVSRLVKFVLQPILFLKGVHQLAMRRIKKYFCIMVLHIHKDLTDSINTE